MTTNPVVRNAVAARRVAANGQVPTLVKVTLETVSYAQGRKVESRTMRLDAFDVLLRKLGLSQSHDILLAIQSGGAEVPLTIVLEAEAI